MRAIPRKLLRDTVGFKKFLGYVDDEFSYADEIEIKGVGVMVSEKFGVANNGQNTVKVLTVIYDYSNICHENWVVMGKDIISYLGVEYVVVGVEEFVGNFGRKHHMEIRAEGGM